MSELQLSGPWFRLVADCLKDLQKHRVNVVLSSKSPYIREEGIYTKGYWDDADPKNLALICRYDKDPSKWVPIFTHEYCHFKQWVDRCESWQAARNVNSDDMAKIIQNKPMEREKIEYCLNALRDLELDCEKRTVKLFKKYKIPIDIDFYIKSANAYVHFYNYVKTFRSWYPKNKSPYEHEQILGACSRKFYKSYNKIPKRLNETYDIIFLNKEKKHAKRQR